jgi:hypothetical protein
MSGLTPITSSAQLLLVAAHASAERDVDTRWGHKPKALGDFDEIEFVYIKDSA